jgi:hypothetical protein
MPCPNERDAGDTDAGDLTQSYPYSGAESESASSRFSLVVEVAHHLLDPRLREA